MNRRTLLYSVAGISTAATLGGCFSTVEDRLFEAGSIDDRDPTPRTDGTGTWPGEGFDSANSGYNPDTELLEAELSTASRTRGGSDINTSLGGGIAVADGRCYFGTSSGDVVCYTAAGERRWEYTADTAAGVRSIPSLSEDVVYLSSDNGTYALDAEDGEALWTSDAFVRWGSSVLTTEHLYALGGDGVLALDVETGERDWDGDAPRPSALAVIDGTVYTTSISDDGGAAAVADGDVIWLREDVTDCHEPPVVTEDLVLVCDGEGRLEALDREDGATVWSYDRSGRSSTMPAVAHDHVYLPSGNGSRTICLDLETGDTLWNLSTGVYHDQPVAVADGVYFGTPNEGLFAVAPDGTVRWREDELRIDGRMAAVDGALYVVAFGGAFGSGDLYALTTAA
ncbi:outer membrane protein assembly factor BamB family protein [Natronorubrum sp. DTA28]|uniref:outer membrane protein assembly factor BamB family protein n=1 Tax=Natronorubrum sp. DTA28 TaxID=3447019 RepID=UPI003F838023